MCDHDDRRGRRDFGPPGGDRSDFGPRRDECRQPPSWAERDSLDPVDWFRETIEDVTESAFLELVEQRVKARLEATWGEKLDEIVNLVVDHFIQSREEELSSLVRERDFNAKLRDTLKKNR